MKIYKKDKIIGNAWIHVSAKNENSRAWLINSKGEVFIAATGARNSQTHAEFFLSHQKQFGINMNELKKWVKDNKNSWVYKSFNNPGYPRACVVLQYALQKGLALRVQYEDRGGKEFEFNVEGNKDLINRLKATLNDLVRQTSAKIIRLDYIGDNVFGDLNTKEFVPVINKEFTISPYPEKKYESLIGQFHEFASKLN